jgi:hypothetical protein
MFRINLHKDDVGVLHMIKDRLGIGTVETHAKSCVFVVRSVSDLLKVLVPILDTYTLHTTKYLDYVDFKAILTLLSNAPSTAVPEKDKEFALSVMAGMNSGRTTPLIDLIPNLSITKY